MLKNIDGIVTKDDIYRLLSHATTGTPDNDVIITPKQLSSLCALVKALPSKDYEPDDDWINIKDRLPDKDGLYIVCKTIKPHQIVFEARWKGDKWLSVVKNNQLDYVTHWQPLPEPPKEE